MKKVTDKDVGEYVFGDVKYRRATMKKEIAVDKIEKCSELIKIRITDLESRISELRDALEIIDAGKAMYRIGGGDYIYVDKDGKTYEYNVVNHKPVLISSDFKMYEIIEHCDMSDIGQDKGNGRSVVYAYVDKVVKTRLIK